MGYKFNDANGYLEAGPSINGLKEIKDLATEYQARRPALEQLIQHGHTDMLLALQVECRNLANKTNDKDVKHSLLRISALASKASEVLIMEH